MDRYLRVVLLSTSCEPVDVDVYGCRWMFEARQAERISKIQRAFISLRFHASVAIVI